MSALVPRAMVLRAGPVSLVLERRTVVACLALVGAAGALAILGLCYGARWRTPIEVIDALVNGGRGSVTIREWRAPRVVAALVFGAALAVAGALFQNLTRNPLGSPDVIGLDAGAYTGALVAITVLSGTATQLAVGSAAGGLLAALAIYLLSMKSGVTGLRLIVIGIAVNAILTAVNSWIILRAELDVAIAATGWNAGSLNGMDWDELRIPFVVLAVLAVALVAVARALRQAELGDELAMTTGVRIASHRLAVVVIGVGLTSTVTAVAGPIVFIALAAPQIGRRLAGASGVPLIPAALTGAVLLLGADLIAQMLLAPTSLPVGAVTTAIGGAYLFGLLAKGVRRR